MAVCCLPGGLILKKNTSWGGFMRANIQELNDYEILSERLRSNKCLFKELVNLNSEAIGVILHERQTELFCEWGHRWFDLKRTDSINSVLGREKPQYWAPDGHEALYPIPQIELRNNTALIQNPGF